METALAGRCGDDAELVSEAADLLYHLTVLLKVRNLAFADVIAKLKTRAGVRPAFPLASADTGDEIEMT